MIIENTYWKFTFGKYKDHLIGKVIEDNPAYIKWAIETIRWFSLSEDLRNFHQEMLEVKPVRKKYRSEYYKEDLPDNREYWNEAQGGW